MQVILQDRYILPGRSFLSPGDYCDLVLLAVDTLLRWGLSLILQDRTCNCPKQSGLATELVSLQPLRYNAASLNSRKFLMTKHNLDTRQLRAIAHRLKPIVTVAQNGVSETVAREIDQALSRHELIKVKIVVGDRELRREIASEISSQAGAELVQSIGNVIVLYRAARQPDPRLSNILRHRELPGA